MEESNPPRDASLPPGYDEEDPYEDVDLDSYPAWWRRNVEEFRRFGLRPYRPPRFLDGEFTTEVIDDLEAELGVEVRLRTTDPSVDHDWEVWVGDECVSPIEKRREGAAYSEYYMESSAFVELVRSHVCDDTR